MKINIHQIVLALFLLTTISACVAPDFDKGKEAYNKGETDLQKWQGLAEQGNAKAQFNLGVIYDSGRGVPEDDRRAVFWYSEAAKRGDANAQNNLGVMYANGRGVPKNDRQAMFWFHEAAERGNENAKNNLGFMYSKYRGVPEDDREAVSQFLKAAKQGIAEAQFKLGFMYVNGKGVPKDASQAELWWIKAAEQGNAEAQFNLGLMYGNGKGVPKDANLAVFWYRKAAEQGDAKAQFNLGFMYANGKDVPKDANLAVFWYRKAAEQGDAKAQSKLGFMYANGKDVSKDVSQAELWWIKAAEQGNAEAQFNLGVMYVAGRGVPEDDRRAMFWFHEAAERGNANAQNNLGAMYDKGRGVPEDDREAVFWYRKAAEQGIAKAQFNLGVMYADGRGVPEDNVQSFAWFDLAAGQGDEDAKEEQDNIQKHMTPSQTEEGQKLSQEIAARIERNQSDSDSSSFADTLYSVLKQEEKKWGWGSGFVVGGRDGETTFIVTNHHVVEDCAKVTVVYAGISYEASVRAKDANRDLALVETKIPILDVLPASFSTLDSAILGQDVWVPGYSGYPPQLQPHSNLTLIRGSIATTNFILYNDVKRRRRIEFTPAAQKGNSGSPLLDTAGHVIGVVVSGVKYSHDDLFLWKFNPFRSSFAIEALQVRNFLDKNRVRYRELRSDTELKLEKINEQAHSFTVAVQCWK